MSGPTSGCFLSSDLSNPCQQTNPRVGTKRGMDSRYQLWCRALACNKVEGRFTRLACRVGVTRWPAMVTDEAGVIPQRHPHQNCGSSGMNVGDRAVWPLVSPCGAMVLGWTGRAAICTRSSHPPSSAARAAMTKRSAFGALPS